MSKPTPPIKYIFVTGGVVSSLGKGLAAASLGTLLEHRGLRVIIQKFDPYLNVDPGTMSPYQHGEVYVLDDGAETDLDLGHYERFTNGNLTKNNNLTSGQVYERVLEKERRGDYLGATVQVIPHVTEEIKNRIYEVSQSQNPNIIITEIGGTVGDIEGLPFLEAMRQFALEVGKDNIIFIHVTLVPFIAAAGELKTKPTQQSVAKLQELGIQPDIIICRTEHDLDDELRRKISMFCNVPRNAVIQAKDMKHSIYELPLELRSERLDRITCDLLRLETERPDLNEWEDFVRRVVSPKYRITIAVVGKYIELQDAYKSIYEALTHAGAAVDCGLDIVKVDAEHIERDGAARHLAEVGGILIPGGFGDRGIEGKILAAQYAREQMVPYFGLCLGMQIATIEYARHVCSLDGANSTEFDKATAYPLICLLETQKDVNKKGGSMRLGTWVTDLKPNTLAYELYQSATITERHRHRYEVNPDYKGRLEEAGLTISGSSPDGTLAEIVEISEHPFFIAVQYHPEFLSKPNHPHVLFKGFVEAVLRGSQLLVD